MKRLIDYYLYEWKNRSTRKPLILRGARQVGKTHAIRELGKTFPTFIEINLEFNQAAKAILEKDVDPNRIILQLSELLQKKITPGSTLLFFDEIQNVPKAITALRYFYELIPDLHVVAAGSLLDFALEEVGMPVGRVTSLYLYPLSFIEFLAALNNNNWINLIIKHPEQQILNEQVHAKLIELVGMYLAIGGMPEAIVSWIETKTSWETKIVHEDLLYTYQQDFGRYSKKYQHKYLNILLEKAINQLSKKFIYSHVGEYKKRELEPSLDLLVFAGLFYKVIKTSGQGIPLGSGADLDDFKLLFLDVGLSQALLKNDISQWFINPINTFINKGEIVEAFIGQELLAYANPINKHALFYWHNDTRSSESEMDYLVQIKDQIVPIEVKAGKSKRIKSMRIFLETHVKSIYGLRFSADNYHIHDQIYSYPLYSVIKPFIENSEQLQKAVHYMLT
jgi:uncharacterized protein